VLRYNVNNGPSKNNAVTGGAHMPFECTPDFITGKYAGFQMRSLSCTRVSYADEPFYEYNRYENDYSTAQSYTEGL
jgi:hypothetical protein